MREIFYKNFEKCSMIILKMNLKDDNDIFLTISRKLRLAIGHVSKKTTRKCDQLIIILDRNFTDLQLRFPNLNLIKVLTLRRGRTVIILWNI